MEMPAALAQAGFDPRTVPPCGTGANKVLVVGEAPGEQEADTGVPFYPGAQAGSVLDRAIRRIGAAREQFAITNVVPWRPPNNWLEGAPWQDEAIHACEPFLEETIGRLRPSCILALGGVACRATTGLAGDKLGISYLAGYVLPGRHGVPVVACYHPSFLRRGATSRSATGEKGKRGGMALFGVLLRCLRLATQVAAERRKAVVPPVDNPPPGYTLHPDKMAAEWFMEEVRSLSPDANYLAYDIETPYSTTEDDAEERAGDILSIQFSYSPGSGIFLPWRDPYIAIAKQIMALPIAKIGWNNWRFDDPRLRANGVLIGGTNYDLMWAWHHSQPDLPRGLQFGAAMMGPAIHRPSPAAWPWPWKHLDKAAPEFYGIVDVDVLQHMVTEWEYSILCAGLESGAATAAKSLA